MFVFCAGDVWSFWMGSMSNVRTTQVFGLLINGILSIIYTIISTIIQVLIIKAMVKVSKVSAKFRPVPDYPDYYGYRYLDYHITAPQVRILCTSGIA